MRRKNLIGMLVGAFILCSFSLLTFEALAQGVYPARNIDFICYSNPGGGYDILARGMAPFLTKHLKEVSPGAKGGEIKVKNMVGAGGAKAIQFLHDDAKPDGYTIGDFNKGNAYKFQYGDEKLPFNIMEVTWLVSLARSNRVLISKRFATWEEMLASAKKEPLTIISSVPGTAEHFDSIFFKEGVGLPGKIANTGGGTALAISALLRGDGDVYVIAYESGKALIEGKEVKALVTFTEDRLIPQVPTIVEKGFPKLSESVGGKGARIIIAPPKLAPEPRRILIAAFRRMLADPEFKTFCEKGGFDLNPTWEKDLEALMGRYFGMLNENSSMLKKYGI